MQGRLGVHYSEDADCYDCDDDLFTFGVNETNEQHGNTTNIQQILYDGEVVGTLVEFAPYNIMKPMQVRFVFFVPEDHTSDHPNFIEDEDNGYHFATLQMFADFVKGHNELVKEYYDVEI